MKRNGEEQVKIRGFRVELGEVRAALTELAGVDQAAVIVREDRPGDRRLVGYVTESPVGAVDPAGARAGLAERLPSYMIPAEVMVLEALPLTGDGDIDTRALPAPELSIDPRIKQVLHDVFARLLGVEHVGIDESFFDLGGDSLSAMRAITAVNAALNVDLKVGALFNSPTIAQLASRIDGNSGGLKPLVGCDPARGDSVVVRAEPAVVHRPIAGALTGLQQVGGAAPARTAECRSAECGAGRSGGSA